MICRKTKKHCHSKGEAKAHVRSLKEKDGDLDVEVYPCVFCHFFHVGHVRATGHINKYKKGT